MNGEHPHDGRLLDATRETERIVAWLRLPALALLAVGPALAEAEPADRGFGTVIVLFGIWSIGVLAWAYTREVTRTFALVATAADVIAVTALALLSGGAHSQARVAYFLVPIAVAFRFSPRLTASAAAGTVAAYLAQAIAQPTSSRQDALPFIAVFAGYLAWVGVASVALSYVLARRTRHVAELAAARRRLLAEVLSAETRERQALAEALHDRTIQNLLAARQDLAETAGEVSHPALERAADALGAAASELRETVLDLHPHVLEEAGLEVALPAVARRAASQAGFHLHVDVRYRRRHRHERVLLAAARELLTNAARHADAEEVNVRLFEADGELILTVSDDGCGFETSVLPSRLANGHIGLAAQRLRVEAAGGRLDLRTAPGGGTTGEVRLPLDPR